MTATNYRAARCEARSGTDPHATGATVNASIALALSAGHLLLVLAVAARVLLRPDREPASRVAWIVVVIAPALG